MIVRLTHAQADGLRKRINPFHVEMLDAHRAKAGRTRHDFDMPAIAWRQILDHLIATCYGPQGGRLAGRRRPPDSLYLAIKAIAEAVRSVEAHPAWRGAAVEGCVGVIVPTFIGEDGRMGPYPGEHDRFVMLWPVHGLAQGMMVTTWEISYFVPDAASWTFDEYSHRVFVGLSASPDA